MRRGPLPLLLPALVLLLAAAPAGAEERSSAAPRSTLGEVEARLSADDPGVAAWGAYLTGRDGHREAVPQLRTLLRAHRAPYDRDWNLAHRSALDALIRLAEDVDDGLLGLHERRFPVQVLVIRARHPDRHVDALTRLLERLLEADTLGNYGLAVGNLVVAQRPAGIGAILLTRVRMRLTVRVFTPDASHHGGIGIGGVRGGFGDALAKVPAGFPPYVHYSLWGAGGRGRELLASGPRPIWSQRTERARAVIIPSGPLRYDDPSVSCLEWLGVLLENRVEDLPVETERSMAHGFTTNESYLAALTRAREAMLERWWHVALLLKRAGLLQDAEAHALVPSFALAVRDERGDRLVPLPLLPPPSLRPEFARQP